MTGPDQATVRPEEEQRRPGLDEVCRTQASWLARFFRRQLGNREDAQDLTQETMLRYIRAAPATAAAPPQAYLHRIAVNLLRDRFKSSDTKMTRSTRPLIEGLDQADDFDQHRTLAGREELEQWQAILDRLPARTLEIFLFSRIDNCTYKEIATKLGMTVPNVRRHMIKAIAHVERHRRQR